MNEKRGDGELGHVHARGEWPPILQEKEGKGRARDAAGAAARS